MSFTVTVRPSGREFSVENDESALSAALRQGVTLPYGCRDGACGSCKAKVISGSVTHGPHQLKALSHAEEAQGFALMCCAHPQSHLEIESREVAAAGAFPIKKMPTRIASIEFAADDVAILMLQLPANERMQYHAGQYVEFLMRDGSRRSYSMASAPHLADKIELHIRHLPGGKFTDALFGKSEPATKVRDILRIEAPLGTFFLREDSTKPIVLLASGTGFAPIKAIVEHAIFKKISRPMVLYWGARSRKDLYQHDTALALVEQARLADVELRYIPVLSDPKPDDAWTGRTGFVHHAVMADMPDLSQVQVYACGAPIMVDSARSDFTLKCALPEDEFFADSFTSEADKQTAVVV